MESNDFIVCKGVKTHNLKGIDLKIPLYKWTAITGVSGSGKSSLVFDTLYAEAQRRFLETLGTYERQFLGGLPQGDFDEIQDIPAAVALKQSNRSTDPRSLIGTSADVFEPLRLLFMALMDSSCSKCGSPVESHSAAEATEYMQKKWKKNSDENFLLSVSYVWPTEKKKKKDILRSLMLEGHIRILANGKIEIIEEIAQNDLYDRLSGETFIVLDRIAANTELEEVKNRIESIWSQVKFSPQFSTVEIMSLDSNQEVNIGSRFPLRVQPFCKKCNTSTTIIQGSDLDWQSVLGACSTCKGLGNIPIIDELKVFPNQDLSLKNGAIKPWSSETFSWMNDNLLKACKAEGIKIDVPYKSLDHSARKWIWYGPISDKKSGKNKDSTVFIKDFFDVLESERYKRNSRIMLSKFRKYVVCHDCNGLRLGEAGRNAQCANMPFHALMNLEIREVRTWLEEISNRKEIKKRLEFVSEIYEEVYKKIDLLSRLGMGTSVLSRRCRTLSGGEYQRVLLSRVLGNGLTDALYVLDEPSIGLGKSEIPDLISCIQELCSLGNTIVMVEHEPSLIRAADLWIELGPGGGSEGGYLVPQKSDEPVSFAFKKFTQSVPLRKTLKNSTDRIYKPKECLFIKEFSALNCRNLNIEIPLANMTVICGPSGAGKSTLVHFGLQAAIEHFQDSGNAKNEVEDLDDQKGVWKEFAVPPQFFETHEVVSVEQKALHRTVTSVPATVLGLMDSFRKYFAATDGAKQLGFTASDFSFNGAGGCETCNGRALIKEDLFFLGEVEKICPECNGTRYRSDVLKVKWLGKTIHEWLLTSLTDCAHALKSHTTFSKPLQMAVQLGIGHLPLGMPTASISGGEAQRLRLASALTKSENKIFCILDEPTRGLSEFDVGNLLQALLQLSSQGHTFVIVEHHEQFQKYAHHLVIMGPGGGADGGRIVERQYV